MIGRASTCGNSTKSETQPWSEQSYTSVTCLFGSTLTKQLRSRGNSSRMSPRVLKSTACSRIFSSKRSTVLLERLTTLKSFLASLEEVSVTAYEEMFGFGKAVYNNFKVFFNVSIRTVLRRIVRNARKIQFQLTLYWRQCSNHGERYPIFETLSCFSEQSANYHVGWWRFKQA